MLESVTFCSEYSRLFLPCLIPPKQAIPIAAKNLRCLHAATSPPPHSQPQNRCPRCRSVDVLDIGESMSSTSVQRLWKSPKRLSGRAPNQDVAKSPPSHLSSPFPTKNFSCSCAASRKCASSVKVQTSAPSTQKDAPSHFLLSLFCKKR